MIQRELLNFINEVALRESAEFLDIDYGCKIVKVLSFSDITDEGCSILSYEGYGANLEEDDFGAVSIADTYPLTLHNNIHRADMILCAEAGSALLYYILDDEPYESWFYLGEYEDTAYIIDPSESDPDTFGLFAHSFFAQVPNISPDAEFTVILVSFCIYTSLSEATAFELDVISRIQHFI